MKKRNKVLEILVCAALVAVVFSSYMTVAQKDSGLEIKDISGARAHLGAFSFEGIAGDPSGYHHFLWENDKLETKYQPVNGWAMDALLTTEKEGKNIKKYFAKRENDYMEPDGAIFPVPADDTKVKQITDINELTSENRLELLSEAELRMSDMQLEKGYITDEITLYAEVTDYKNNRYTRFPTGMTLSGEEYYFLKTHYGNDRGSYETSLLKMDVSVTETEDAFYAILQTNADCEGEVFLQRIPKEEMASGWGDSELKWKKVTRGKAEILCAIPVNAESRIISLTHTDEDHLLLARSENDVLLLELYDIEGNFITQLKTDVEQASKYELDHVTLLREEEEVVLWFELARRVSPDGTGKNGFYYEIDGARYYVCDKESIRELPISGYPEYLDHADGKVLFMEYDSVNDQKELEELMDFNIIGYKLKIFDDETGKLLYEGKLTSKFEQDCYRRLTALNIGKRAGYLSEQENRWDKWTWDEIEKTKIRNFSGMLPVHGEMESLDWTEENTSGYREYRYY